jgi:hypothetical protein
MQFTGEVNWGSEDFIFMGILLLITSLLCEAVMRFAKTTNARFIAVGIILFVFFLVWAEAAVGIFNSPIAGS